jgi:hypothetical protein
MGAVQIVVLPVNGEIDNRPSIVAGSGANLVPFVVAAMVAECSPIVGHSEPGIAAHAGERSAHKTVAQFAAAELDGAELDGGHGGVVELRSLYSIRNHPASESGH